MLGALRRGRALSGRGAGHLGRRAGCLRAGQPRAPVRLRSRAGGAPRRGPRHQHRDATGHRVGGRRGRVLEGGRGASSATPREDAGAAVGLGLSGIIQGMLGAEPVKGARSSPPRRRRRARCSSGSCPRRRRPRRRPRRSPSTSRGPAARRARRTYVAGASLTVHDFVDAIYSRFPWIIAFVVGVHRPRPAPDAAQRRASA